MNQIASRVIVTAAAVVLAASGVACLFAPVGVLELYGADASAAVIVQQFGVALVGLAVANWITQGSPVGGIYGRAIVSADLAYFGATFLLYAANVAQDGSAPVLWGNLILSGILAILFALILFGRI